MAEDEDEVKKEQTAAEKLLFYITASFVLLGTFSLFAFLFLVPFVIEPAITTIVMEFSETPALCVTSEIIWNRGASNCSWTSCKEGCTKEVYECTQIRVNYKVTTPEPLPSTAPRREERAIREYDYPDIYSPVDEDLPPEPPSPTGLMGNTSEWYYIGAKLFPNVKGCGYPPSLNCSVWYKTHLGLGTNYSCYYSRIDPGLVISDLDMNQVYMNLVYATAIPIPSFIVSVIYLTIAYFYIYYDDSDPPRRPPRGGRGDPVEVTPLPMSTPQPPPTSGALTPASEIFREDLASFGHQLKICMADDMSRESIIPDSVPFINSNSMNGNLNKMMTTSILTPPGPIADV
ncbi:protein tipE isoform X2 [Macrosteles quadrilineatus]|uniref:protein tipE isoform X2 n=1 Tax=Macrosteles quadrilineatus TaxID=74068 RepID=UPI0023E14F74|nr:protein tipE isoform X2 [Macrosteles quadrilineatus]